MGTSLDDDREAVSAASIFRLTRTVKLFGNATSLRCKAAIIYEGTRDIHTLMQADWALGIKKEKAARKTLPPYRPAEGRESVAAD